jgi:Ca2+-binding RTX toxin-like protein
VTVTANFSPNAGLLSALGDNARNTITVSRDAAGSLLVNGGSVAIRGGKATIANTTTIQLNGLGGDDVIALDESNGVLPAAVLFGGAGNDTITGGSGADQLFGQDGNDILNGKAGDDLLFGGAGNDVLTGGSGNDQVFGQDGNDRMIWNPGDGNDLFEGGAGIDTAEVNGGNGAETFTITANGDRVRLDRLQPAPFNLDIGTTENLVINANGGDDIITAGNGLAGLIQLTIDGGDGNDTITGGDGNDVLIGGDGNDTITGGRGNDTASLGAGDDVFIWNPGDGSDVVDGQAGTDTLLFNGANVGERIDISANRDGVIFSRDVGAVTMTLKSIEQIQFNALGGADNIAINDLTGSGTKQVTIDLASPPGSGNGDGQADSVTINGTAHGDHITVANSGNSVVVQGLPAQVTVNGAEGANDTLSINGAGGNDTIDAQALEAGHVRLVIDAGDGNDTIIGSGGADLLIGGAGNDVVTGGAGNDTALLGDGNDQFIWNPGDGSDVVEGQAGNDRLVFNGSNAAETMSISANGTRATLFRDVGNVTMDLNGIETIQLGALGGADSIVVNDLSGTDVKQVAIDLAGSAGAASGDGQADRLVANGTAGDDAIRIVRSGGGLAVNGLAAQVTIAHAEGADSLVINGLGGNDTIDASALGAGAINLMLNGGDGDDVIIGSGGNDTVVGGRGNDTAMLGAGDDVFVWNPGDGSDVVEGQSGTDTLLFNGANVGENIDLSANGGRVRLFRDVGNVTMDLNSIEHVQLNALGGADTITVNDLTGTRLAQLAIDLGGVPGGGGDGQPDTIIINATSGDDVITIASHDGVVTVAGLATEVTIANFDASDRIVINGLGGDDIIEASGLGASIQLTENGGDGDVVRIGGAGNDTLRGGAGDDVLIGGPGQDVLDGGPGDNINIQSAIGPAPLGGGADVMQAVGTGQPSAFNGTAGDDVIAITGNAAGVTLHGLAPDAVVVPADASDATITINGLDGNDTIDAAGLAAPKMQFIFNGGSGNDVLHGGQGNDRLTGGQGADRFEFSGVNGTDTITDFQHALDQIRITGYGAALDGFDDLRGHMVQTGADVRIDLGARVAGAGVIVLQHAQLATIGAGDFSFS